MKRYIILCVHSKNTGYCLLEHVFAYIIQIVNFILTEK